MPDLDVWPTDGAAGSVSSEARWRKMARLWSNTGVRSMANDLVPTLVAGPAVSVTIGQCWIDGHFCELTAPASIPITTSGIVVVRFTPADNHAELLYRDGVTVPTQTDPTYEMVVAQVSAGAVFDKRILAIGGEQAVAASADATITAINPTYGTIPGSTLPVWGVGQYLLTIGADVDVTALAAGNLIYLSPQSTGPVVWGTPSGINPRTFWDMNAVRRDCRQWTWPFAVTAPAAAVLTLGACKGSATGTVIVRQTTSGTFLHVRRIG